nr:hypothetical protein [Tanacetum cinerariifolium]
MSTPTIAETHNLVAFLEKPSKSEGFEQIIDFLNTKPIRYALTVNPTVYASCVKQFWTTAKVKKVNDQEQIQALVDKQKVKGMAKHKEIYVMSSHTKKIFANMRRQGQGFSGNVTPLFETMMVIAQEEVEIALVNESQGRMQDADMFGVDDLEGNEVFVEKSVEKEVSTTDPVTTAGKVVIAASVEDNVAPTTATTVDVDDELTLAKTLIVIKAAKPKDKGKEKMIEPEKPLKKKDQIALDEEVARKLEAKMKAEMEEKERIAREKDEANRAMIEEWDDVYATIDVDREEELLQDHQSKWKLTKLSNFWNNIQELQQSRLRSLKSIVNERFKKTKPVDDMKNILFQTLKTMFEPHVEDIIWKYQQGAVKVNN